MPLLPGLLCAVSKFMKLLKLRPEGEGYEVPSNNAAFCSHRVPHGLQPNSSAEDSTILPCNVELLILSKDFHPSRFDGPGAPGSQDQQTP